MTSPDAPTVGIPPELLQDVFPFHIAVDRNLDVLQLGRSISRIAPGLEIGTRLETELALERPHGELTPEKICAAADQTFLLRIKQTGIRLRGQFAPIAEDGWLFLGSPWFESAEAIEEAGLSFSDFPIHDPLLELLMLVQTQQMAMKDLQVLTSRLERQREIVKRTERIYRDAISAADAVVYQTDRDEKVYEFIDPGIIRLTGFTGDEMSPEIFSGLVCEARATPETQNDSGTGNGRNEYRILAKDGSERWLLESTIPVLSSDGGKTGNIGILQDITRAKSEETERDRLRRELDTIVRLSPDGLATFDTEGRLSYCNPAFERLTGREWHSLEGASLEELDSLFSELLGRADQAPPLKQKGDGELDELELLHPERRTISRMLQRVLNEHGELKGSVLFVRDITREREIDRMKSEFLSTAAHELRTPMTSVRGFAELLLSDDFDSAMTREIAETIHRQATLLVKIVNELLDIARIEAGHGKDFVYAPILVNDLVLKTIDALRMPDDDRKVEVSLMPDDSPVIRADAAKTTLALTNILSNAYKYSPNGGSISLSVNRRTEGEIGLIAIAVSDEGVGMSDTAVVRIFERFFRADPSGSIPGTGLGMSLVKEIIELQGGRVEVKSQKGAGTTVTILFPELGSGTYTYRQTETA